jgi:hypothetical protein
MVEHSLLAVHTKRLMLALLDDLGLDKFPAHVDGDLRWPQEIVGRGAHSL